jgi:hypothetical protein
MNKLIRDELSAETNLRVKDLRVKNTQLVEALRFAMNFGSHFITDQKFYDVIDKALSDKE